MASPAPGKLYVVATPIGNLDDLSPRAAATLQQVDLVAAEDTRVTGRLLKRLGVRARMLSYRDENERSLAPKLVERIAGGETVALVSDAGTPAISDPGYRLVKAAAEAGIEVVAVAGPSALTALLSIGGLPTDRFSFEGFPPNRAQARRKMIAALAGAGRTVVFYESPRRVAALLADIAELLADPPVAVGRELTKMHEEVLRGRASEVAAGITERGARGEFVVSVYVEDASDAAPEGAELDEEVAVLLEAGASVKEAAAALKPRGVARRAVYEAARRISAARG